MNITKQRKSLYQVKYLAYYKILFLCNILLQEYIRICGKFSKKVIQPLYIGYLVLGHTFGIMAKLHLVFLYVYCFSIVKVILVPLRVERKLYKLFYYTQNFSSFIGILIPQLKWSSWLYLFPLTLGTFYKKYSFCF